MGYQEMNMTWLNPNMIKDDDECKVIDTGMTQRPYGMHMPVTGGLDGCKGMCNERANCSAIEYAPKPDENGLDCCILVHCTGDVPAPMETEDHYHGGDNGYIYKGYKKVMSDMNGYGSSSMMPGSSSMMPMMSTSADQPANGGMDGK